MKLLKVLFTFALFALPSLALAVPLQIPYSGQLSESGTPVNGTRNIMVNVYDVPTGGSLLYTENFAGTQVTNGIFHVTLNAPDTVWTGADRWLGVSVNGGAELTPRTKIGSVPYAVRTAAAEALVNPLPQVGGNYKYDGNTVSPYVTSISWVAVDQITVSCPADGYLITSASGSIILDNATGYLGRLRVQEQAPSDLGGGFIFGGSSTPGWMYVPVTISEVQSVTAGVHTITVWAHLPSGTYQSYRYYRHTIQALWFPNRYQ
ncbi:MAG: hypothetical protein HY567_03230 [Candidatus Kerfeldbacteria bacterium]|nr:hypothetical protein [Candidatus Kerfeldbacteria bacterium]